MSSVTTKSFKQTNGYFVAMATIPLSQQFKVAIAPTGSGGSVTAPVMAAYAAGEPVIAANTLLKDMGKTLMTSTRTYRKVQAVVSGNSSAGVTPAAGLPFYIELVTGQGLVATAASVSYLPGLF